MTQGGDIRVGLVLTLAAILIVPALGLAAAKEGDWKGKLKDEPGSKVTFEVKSSKKAVDFKAKPVPVFCGIFPNGHLETRTVVIPKLKIDGKAIAGEKTYRDGGEVIGTVIMSGDLKGKGKVKGTITYEDFNCDGEEKFSAKAK
jgi:hypothetical protein